MSKSQLACSISTTECSVVRLKTSGSNGYILSECKTLPLGLGDLAAGRGKRILKKVERHLKEWGQENLAFCVEPGTYLHMPAYFPVDASPSKTWIDSASYFFPGLTGGFSLLFAIFVYFPHGKTDIFYLCQILA